MKRRLFTLLCATLLFVLSASVMAYAIPGSAFTPMLKNSANIESVNLTVNDEETAINVSLSCSGDSTSYNYWLWKYDEATKSFNWVDAISNIQPNCQFSNLDKGMYYVQALSFGSNNRVNGTQKSKIVGIKQKVTIWQNTDLTSIDVSPGNNGSGGYINVLANFQDDPADFYRYYLYIKESADSEFAAFGALRSKSNQVTFNELPSGIYYVNVHAYGPDSEEKSVDVLGSEETVIELRQKTVITSAELVVDGKNTVNANIATTGDPAKHYIYYLNKDGREFKQAKSEDKEVSFTSLEPGDYNVIVRAFGPNSDTKDESFVVSNMVTIARDKAIINSINLIVGDNYFDVTANVTGTPADYYLCDVYKNGRSFRGYRFTSTSFRIESLTAGNYSVKLSAYSSKSKVAESTLKSNEIKIGNVVEESKPTAPAPVATRVKLTSVDLKADGNNLIVKANTNGGAITHIAYRVFKNGVRIDEIKTSDTSITINNLEPDTYQVIAHAYSGDLSKPKSSKRSNKVTIK